MFHCNDSSDIWNCCNQAQFYTEKWSWSVMQLDFFAWNFFNSQLKKHNCNSPHNCNRKTWVSFLLILCFDVESDILTKICHFLAKVENFKLTEVLHTADLLVIQPVAIFFFIFCHIFSQFREAFWSYQFDIFMNSSSWRQRTHFSMMVYKLYFVYVFLGNANFEYNCNTP